jgi:CRP-like cAMP-binding protein
MKGHSMATNLLLSELAPDVAARLDAKFELVTLPIKSYVMRPDEPISHVYFPLTGLISIVVNLEDGGTVETLTVANEGFTGLPLLLGQSKSTRDAFVQIAGDFKRIPTKAFLEELSRDQRLHECLAGYASYAISVIEQSAACLAFHALEARLARWLLSVDDRLPGKLPLTHEFLGQMLGVYRPSVTLAIGILQDAGLISSRRGVIQIIDRGQLELVACECYLATRFWPMK